MSGNEERNGNHALVCPYCGSRKFAFVYYGFNVNYYNAETDEAYRRGWEATDSEGWQCDSCERFIEDTALTNAIDFAYGHGVRN